MEGTRLFRSIWVGLVNGCGIIMLAETIASERKMYNLLETKTPLHTYFLPVLGIVILFAGILLELKQSRAAGYWNTGVYVVLALYSLGLIVISSAGETEARNYGILFGVPSFIIAVATSLLYWRASLRRKHPPQPTAS